MTSHNICPLVIAKILRVTSASWADIGTVPEHAPVTAQKGHARERTRHDDKPSIRTSAAQGFGLQRHTGWSARPRVAALFSDWGTLPRA